MPLLKPALASYHAKRGRRRAGISAEERLSSERRGRVEGTMEQMFQERAKDPYGSVMPLEEQKYYDERRLAIYGQESERQQQSLMAAMNRTGAMASGATNYNLMRFGQETLRDQQQFYFEDQANRLGQRETAYMNTMQSGAAILGSPVQGTQQTDLMNARTQEHNQWRARWGTMIANTGLG